MPTFVSRPFSRIVPSHLLAKLQACPPRLLVEDKSGGWQIRSLLFFVLFYLYLWLEVDTRLIYHGAGVITNFPSFYRGWAFFQTFTSYPGGPVEYLCAFLSQLFCYSWLGALVVTLQAWLICLCIDYLLRIVGSPRLRWLCFAAPILLLISYNWYTYHFVTTMALLVALILACLYLLSRRRRASKRSHLLIFLVSSVMLYYLVGAAFLLFAAICTVYEMFFQHRWRTSLLYLLAAGLLPYIEGTIIFGVSIVDAFSREMPFSWRILCYTTRRRAVTLVYLLYGLPLITTLMCGFWLALADMLRSAAKRASKAAPAPKSPGKPHRRSSKLPARIAAWYKSSPRLSWTIESLVLIALAGAAVQFSRNDELKTRFQVDYYAYHKMWPQVLLAARRYPADPLVVHAVNRALFHTGRLGYEMFSWPQDPDYLFLTDSNYEWAHWHIFDVHLDIGLVNIAENALTECLEGLGDRPMVLQRLALINMAKGNIGSAGIYLGALSKTLFHARWANQYLALLRAEPNLGTVAEVQHLRSLWLDKDYPTLSLPKEKVLSLLLDKNSQNRMAFEYLMAWYLLNKQLGKFASNIDRLRGFGYLELPTHYEEAALIYVYGTGKPVALGGYQPSPTLRRQIEDFSRILRAYGADKRAAFNDLARNYRDTYFFYYIYAHPGTSK
jgi:hypothetical protein